MQDENFHFMWSHEKISLPVMDRVFGFNSHIPIQLHLSGI